MRLTDRIAARFTVADERPVSLLAPKVYSPDPPSP